MVIGDAEADAISDLRGERFELKRMLGTGAMGVVYEALDTVHGAVVALKVLHRVEPEALFQFKAEFRTLSNLTHRNLLQLFELTTRGDDYVLAMELVNGTDFLTHVRSAGAATYTRDTDEDTGSFDEQDGDRSSTRPREGAAQPSLPPDTRLVGELDEAKLRSALLQLAEGLHALHRSGRLHRDLKPANVLVFHADARVVLCDFGLVVETATQSRAVDGNSSAPVAGKAATRGQVAGSLAFMSPEQSVAGKLGPESDWYAVGVMLYQALTNRVPFDPNLSFADAVHAKHEQTPPAPRLRNPEAPADLSELAMALLNPQTTARAGYSDVLRVLDQTIAPVLVQSVPVDLLIGRAEQLQKLFAALALATAGKATVAQVWGHSGMGKSAVMRKFLRESEDAHGALVLRSRCYECEELPYKVFDPLLDALSQHLLSLDEPAVQDLLPEHTYWLAALFPALRRVRAIAQLRPGPTDRPDPFERKRRAFGAFREICRRLSKARPVILYVDDLQWGDVDSGGPLLELLREPHAPPILFIGAYRAEDAKRSPLLRDLREHHLPASGIQHVIEVPVGSLHDEDARSLAANLLGLAQHEDTIALVVKEAAGNPFFIKELASFVRSRGAEVAQSLRLEDVIQARVDALTVDARTMLDVLAVAGRPEARDLVQRASGLGGGFFRTVQILEAENLVFSTGTQAADKLEPYHDRIRETIYQNIGAERRRFVHRMVAEALEVSADQAGAARDAEALYGHWRNAAEPQQAGSYALLAADKAQEALAFMRAAQLFRAATELLEGDPARTSELEEKLGTALMFAGRGAEAADAFLRAMAGASAERATELRSMAMVQLLGSGHLNRAFEELIRAEDALGIKFPRTNFRAIMVLLISRLRVRLNDATVHVVAGAELSTTALRRVDDLYKVAIALSTVDSLRGRAYTAEMTLRSLRTGDPYRLACALAVESAWSASANVKPERTQWIIDRGAALAEASGELYPVAATRGTAGVSRYLQGRFREAVQLTRESQQIHREQLKGTRAWDYWTVVLFELRAAAELGDLCTIVTRVPETIRDAEERGDLYTKSMARVARLTWAWLAPDQLGIAREQVALAEREWVQEGYHLMHYYRLLSRTEIALYDGSPEACEAAWTELSQQWKPMALLRKIQTCRVQALYMRARIALQLYTTKGDPKLLRAAQADGKALRSEHSSPWADALGQLVLACAASFASRGAALMLLREAQTAFASEQLALYAAAASHAAGRLQNDAVGDAQCAAAETQMRALAVAAPQTFVQMLAPLR